MALTGKQRAFVIEYVKDFNATQSAIRAGYSKKTAKQMGYENLTKPYLMEAIDAFLDENAMKAKEVVQHLTAIARGNIGDLVNELGDPDFEKAASEGRTNLIQTIKTKTVTTKDDAVIETVEFKLYDRLKALDMLAKYHNLTNTTVIHTWQDDMLDGIKSGEYSYDDVVGALEDLNKDVSLAEQWFKSANVPITG